MYRSKDEGHVEMYGRVPSSVTSGDNASDEDNDNEKTPLSGVHDSPWLHRGPSTPTKARRGVTKLVGALRGVSLKRVFQVLGMRRSEVCHLPREIPLDGTFSAAAALARGRKGRGGVNEGLAAAHAVPNIVRNQKYRAVTFVFEVLYEQFRYFFNLYFLLVALSQLIPELQVGFLFTYIAPLVFVLSITLAKEGFDDYKRFIRDKESNSQRYQRLTTGGSLQSIPSSDIRVGDIILIPAGARVPADMVLLRTTDKSGTVFIRTDQLDGETDWKLRNTIALTQGLPSDEALSRMRATVYADRPNKEIDQFLGTFTLHALVNQQASTSSLDDDNYFVTDPSSPGGGVRAASPAVGSAPASPSGGGAWGMGGAAVAQTVEPLTIDNTLWANTVVCGGGGVGLVVYTGTQARSRTSLDI